MLKEVSFLLSFSGQNTRLCCSLIWTVNFIDGSLVWLWALTICMENRQFRWEFKWNSSSWWKFFRGKVISSEVLPFSRFTEMTEIFCTIFVDYQCQASFREKVTNLPEFCKWDNSIPFLFSVSKKNTSIIWRKFFTEISVQMISVTFVGQFSPKFPCRWWAL